MEPPPAGANVGHLSAVHTQIGVDERILSEKADEEVIEVMNGCICCTVRQDLVAVLARLAERAASSDERIDDRSAGSDAMRTAFST